jgi:hypothetical protein
MLLDTTEAQAQGWRSSSRGINRGYSNYGPSARVYGYPTNRANVYSNRAYVRPAYGPNATYSLGYGNYYPSYGYPSGYNYGSNYRNYGYRPTGSVNLSIGNGRFSMYNGFGY